MSHPVDALRQVKHARVTVLAREIFLAGAVERLKNLGRSLTSRAAVSEYFRKELETKEQIARPEEILAEEAFDLAEAFVAEAEHREHATKTDSDLPDEPGAES